MNYSFVESSAFISSPFVNIGVFLIYTFLYELKIGILSWHHVVNLPVCSAFPVHLQDCHLLLTRLSSTISYSWVCCHIKRMNISGPRIKSWADSIPYIHWKTRVYYQWCKLYLYLFVGQYSQKAKSFRQIKEKFTHVFFFISALVQISSNNAMKTEVLFETFE